MNDNATNRGRIFENRLIDSKEEIKQIIIDNNLIYNNIENVIFEYIDSKSTHFKQERKDITELYKKENPLFKCDVRSSIKGDYLIDRIISLDAKAYDKINGRMKFPESILNISDFSKTIDSNYIYLLNYLNNNNLIPVTLRELFDTLINKSYININKYYDLYSTPTYLFKLKKDEIIEIILMYELGFAYKNFGLKKIKIFLIKSDDNLLFNLVDIENITNNDVDVYFYIDNKTKYIYFLFYENNKCFYIISQRKNLKTCNCAFLSKEKIKNIGSISL